MTMTTQSPSIGRPVAISAVLSALMFIFGVPLLMGLPGALFLSFAGPTVEWLRGVSIGGDRAWPAAIAMAWAVPPAIPIIVWIGLGMAKGRRGVGPLLVLAGLWLWSVVVLLGLTAGM
jgi:hypothetical protein